MKSAEITERNPVSISLTKYDIDDLVNHRVVRIRKAFVTEWVGCTSQTRQITKRNVLQRDEP